MICENVYRTLTGTACHICRDAHDVSDIGTENIRIALHHAITTALRVPHECLLRYPPMPHEYKCCFIMLLLLHYV